MWDLVVELVEWYCRPNSRTTMEIVQQNPAALASGPFAVKGTVLGAAHGAKLALQLATSMQKHGLPHNQFTSNLHMLCCR